MALITHSHVRGITAGGVSVTKRIEAQGGAEYNLSEPIPVSAVNQQVALAIDVSQLKSLFIIAAAALVLKTNSSGSPVNTITLAANQPFAWQAGDGTLRDTAGAAITTDITTLYVTNPEAAIVDLKMFVLTDPTIS